MQLCKVDITVFWLTVLTLNLSPVLFYLNVPMSLVAFEDGVTQT